MKATVCKREMVRIAGGAVVKAVSESYFPSEFIRQVPRGHDFGTLLLAEFRLIVSNNTSAAALRTSRRRCEQVDINDMLAVSTQARERVDLVEVRHSPAD
jgi:hypothetical protein